LNYRMTDRENFASFLMRMRKKGGVDQNVLDAIEVTPRRGFVPSQWQDAAFSSRCIPIECGEVIEGLDLQAKMISEMEIDPSHRVLEIGAGSGFSAAVMSRLAQRVTTVDRFRSLLEHARHRMQALRIENVQFRHADGKNGYPGEGTYDRIIVWAAFPSLPRGFLEVLASGGMMIGAIGEGAEEQVVAKLTKIGSRFERQDLFPVRFQPLAEAVAGAL
jgi:protein-L-isoaspartate(D-aspartate) O-methyltransferase